MRAETDRILKESIYQQVVQGRVDQIPESFADPQTSALQKKLGELEVSAAELKVTYGPKYSKLAETNEQIDVIREQISTSRILLSGKLRADYDRASERRTGIEGSTGSRQSRSDEGKPGGNPVQPDQAGCRHREIALTRSSCRRRTRPIWRSRNNPPTFGWSLPHERPNGPSARTGRAPS
jgi:hypothetical protein